MILARMDMDAWVPLVTTLANENVVFEDLCGMTPLLETETTTCRIGLVIGGTTHDLSSESHLLEHWH